MQKYKIRALVLGCVVVAITAIVSAAQSKQTAPTPKPAQPQGQYAATEIAIHKDATSCWTSINGSVYDLTAWIASHPGGEGAILSICGKDGSDAFNNQHSGQGRPEKVLATFIIGSLKK